MSKKFGFSLDSVLAGTDAAEVAKGTAAETPAEAPIAAPEAEGSALEREAGIKPLTIHLAPGDHRRLKQLALDSGRSLQSLGIEAWSLLMQSRGLAPLAPTKANVPDGRRKRGGGEGER